MDKSSKLTAYTPDEIPAQLEEKCSQPLVLADETPQLVPFGESHRDMHLETKRRSTAGGTGV